MTREEAMKKLAEATWIQPLDDAMCIIPKEEKLAILRGLPSGCTPYINANQVIDLLRKVTDEN